MWNVKWPSRVSFNLYWLNVFKKWKLISKFNSFSIYETALWSCYQQKLVPAKEGGWWRNQQHCRTAEFWGDFNFIDFFKNCLKFVVLRISFHLRGCDEKEVLSNDITCEEAVDLQQDWDSSIWHISLGTTHIIDNKDERSYWVKAENFQFSLIASIQLAAAS